MLCRIWSPLLGQSVLFRFSANTLRLAVSCRFTVTVKKLAEKIFAIKGSAWLCMYTTTGYIDAKSITPSDNETTFPDWLTDWSRFWIELGQPGPRPSLQRSIWRFAEPARLVTKIGGFDTRGGPRAEQLFTILRFEMAKSCRNKSLKRKTVED